MRWRFIVLLPLCVTLLSCPKQTSSPDQLTRALDDPHWQVRAAAAEALGVEGIREAAPRLSQALFDDSDAVRTAAASSLGRLGARSQLDAIIGLLERDSKTQVKVQALFTIAALGDSKQAGLVFEKLSDDNRRVRRAARRVLWHLVDRGEFVAKIQHELKTRDVQLRQQAAATAFALDVRELRGWERTLLDDPAPGVRAYAYWQLALHPRPADSSRLLAGLRDSIPAVRLHAVQGLGRLADDEAVPRLREMVGRDEQPAVRKAAAKALASILGLPGSTFPALWQFDRVADRLELARDGRCTLTRTMTLRIDEAAEPITELRILLPAAFPEVERVTDGTGAETKFDIDHHDDLRELVLEVAPLGAGQTATFGLVAESERPLFEKDGAEALLSYSPEPFQAPPRELLVELALPGAGARVLLPADAKLDGQRVSLSRAGLSAQEAQQVVLQVAVPLSTLALPHAPPQLYSRGRDLGLAASIVAVVLALLAAVIVWLRRRREGHAGRAILVAVLAAFAFLLLTPVLLEDNLTYYAMARSAVLDGDLDRWNEYSDFNQTQMYDPHIRNAMDPAFASLFSIPCVAAAHVLTLGLNALSSDQAAPNGFSFPYVYVMALGDFFAVLAGCLACFSLVARRVGERYALFAVLAVVFGTNLLLFTYAWTGGSFQPSFLLFAVFLNYWDKTREERSGLGWLGAGVLMGLMFMTRTLNLGFGLLPFLDWLMTANTLYSGPDRKPLERHVRHGALFAAGVLAGFAPQLILQRLIDHSWAVDRYGIGSGRLTGLRDNLWGMFVHRPGSPHFDGLLPAMPLFVLIFIGLVFLIRLDRRLGVLVTATLAMQILAIGSYEVYWGYFEFGTSYLMPSSPIFALALASLLRAVDVRWKRAGHLLSGSVVLLCVVRNVWCVFYQIADDMLFGWDGKMRGLEVLHRLLLLQPHKLEVDVLGSTSELSCLLRETIGAVRSGRFQQMLLPLFWFSLLLVPLLLAGPVRRGWVSASAKLGPEARSRFGLAAVTVAGLAAVAWLGVLGARTNVDYDYDDRTRILRDRELLLKRLKPGESFTWNFSLSNPCEKFSIITFLEDAADVPQGQPVATVEIEAGQKSQFALRAGQDTAEFDLQRPELQAERRHQVPLDRVCYAYRVRDDSSYFYTAEAYCTRFEVPAVAQKGEMKITSSLAHGTLAIAKLNVRENKLPKDPSRRRWLAGNW